MRGPSASERLTRAPESSDVGCTPHHRVVDESKVKARRRFLRDTVTADKGGGFSPDSPVRRSISK